MKKTAEKFRFSQLPDKSGKFAQYGGMFVPEILMPVLEELIAAYQAAQNDPAFDQTLQHYFSEYVGRPNPLTHADRLSEALGGAQIWLKREDLNHTGAHKINNAIGQLLRNEWAKPASLPKPAPGSTAWPLRQLPQKWG